MARDKESNVVLNFKMDGQVQYAQTIKEINGVMNTAGKEYNNHVSAMKKDATQTEKLRASKKKLEIQLEGAEKRSKLLREEYERSVKETGEYSKESQNLYNKLLQSETGENKLRRALEDTNEALKAQGDASIETAEKLKKIEEVGEKVKGVGKGLTAGVTVPILAIGAASFKMAQDAEVNFAKVSTLLNGNATEMQLYKDKIGKYASDMGISFEEYSESVYSSISAGVDQAQAIEFTVEAVKLAKGGFTDTATAVDLLTTAINAYGLETSDAEKIADFLITTQNLGKTTVNELAASMGAVIPIAQANGVGMDQLSTSYAVLTKNGIATSEAGTGIKAMFSELGKSGTQADKVLQEMGGKSFKQLVAEGADVSTVISNMAKHAEENGLSLADMFGSVEAGTAAMTLSKNSGAEFKEILDSMGSSGEATQEAFDKMDSTNAREMEKALIRLQEIGRQLGEAMLPMFADIMDKVSAALEKFQEFFTNLSPEQKTFIVQMGLVAAAIGPTLIIIGTLMGSITKIYNGFKLVGGGIKIFMGVFKSMSLLLAANPFVLLILGVIALIAIFVLAYNKVKWFRDGVNGFFRGVRDVGVQAFKFMGGYIGGIFDGIKENFSTFASYGKRTFTGLIDFITGVFTGNWSRAWKGVTGIFSGIFEGLGAIAKAPLNNMITLINGFLSGLGRIKIPKWVPGAGGKSFSIPEIPYLAKGGSFLNGQAIVGEAGPELVSSSNGRTKVTPLSNDEKSKGISGASRNSESVVMNVHYGQVNTNSPSELAKLDRRMKRAADKALIGRGGVPV